MLSPHQYLKVVDLHTSKCCTHSPVLPSLQLRLCTTIPINSACIIGVFIQAYANSLALMNGWEGGGGGGGCTAYFL